MVRQRVRMRFTKQGDLRWIGHRDLVRCLERVFRRAGLPLAMSQGYHPKPRMSFPSALAVGIEGLDEVLELQLAESYTAEELLDRLAPHVPPGLRLGSVEILAEGAKKAQASGFSYRVSIPAGRRAGLANKVEQLLAGSSCLVRRGGRHTTVDLRPLLDELSLEDGVLRIGLRVGSGATPGPRDVLSALGQCDLELEGVHLARTAVEVQS